MALLVTIEGLSELNYFWDILTVIAFALLYLAYYLRYRQPHFLFKSTYDPQRKNMKKPPPPFPNGWYNVARSPDVKKEEAKPADINGRNIVVFRGKDGQAYAL